MAMTKAEQKRLDDLEQQLRLAKALRWPTDDVPRPMSRADIDANLVPGGKRHGSDRPQMVARGWFPNSFSMVVTHGCSCGVHHNISGDQTTTQNMGRMYRTEAEAWRVLRHQKVAEFAKALAQIDAHIERASAAVNGE